MNKGDDSIENKKIAVAAVQASTVRATAIYLDTDYGTC